MKLINWQIEGFGCFSNCSLPGEGLSKGLNVIIGPNEAGKSTLLDFVRFTLFGYPSGRASRREPLRGGNHGGTIAYEVTGGVFRLYRGPGRNNFYLTNDKGESCSIDTLGTHFASITKETFHDIFAFSLEELQTVESLERRDDLLFSATVGQAAPRISTAERHLTERSEKLFRERARGGPNAPVLVQLATNARQIEAELDRVRQIARGIGDQLASQSALQAKLQETKDRQTMLQQQRLDIQRMVDGWPHYRTGFESRQKLSSAFPLAQFFHLARELAADQHNYALAAQAARTKAEQLHQREDEWEQIRQDLGPGWDQKTVSDFDVSLLAENDTGQLVANLSRAETNMDEAEHRAEDLGTEVERLRAEIQLEAGPFPDLAERSFAPEAVEGSRMQLGEIRDAIQARAALLQQIDGARLGVRTARLQLAGVAGPPPQRIVPWLFAAAFAVAAVWYFLNGHFAAGMAAAVFTILGLVALFIRRRSDGTVHDEVRTAEQQVAEAERNLQDYDQKWSSVSRSENLEWPVAPALLSQKDRELDAAAKIAKLQTQLRSNENALEIADAAKSETIAQRQSVLAEWQRFLNERKMPATLEPTTALELFNRLRNAKRVLGLMNDLRGEVETDTTVLNQYLDRIRDFLKAREQPNVDNLSAEKLVSAFDEFKDNVESQEESRKELQTKNDEAIRALKHMFGESGAPPQILVRWQKEDPAVWSNEKVKLTDDLTKLSEEHDRQLKELTELETKIAAALNSDEIAELELKHSVVQEQIDTTLSDWCLDAAALELLAATRKQFEQSQQPKALRNASRLFECVTHGNYKEILMPTGEERLRVRRQDDKLVELTELSRGAAEQLYLCARLGYVQHLATDAHVEMPFLMDDVTVNFDPKRLGKAIELIVGCADAGQQFILFTCHPEVATLEGNNFTCFQLNNYDFKRID
jgi:uncharacterized protein YhaN